MNLFADDIKYIARVLEGLSLIYPESNDNSIEARVEIRVAPFGGMKDSKLQTLGKVKYKGDTQWAFTSHDERSDPMDNRALTDSDIFRLPITASGKAYIRNLKEAIDYIGTTLGLHVHATLTDSFNKDEEIGFISNISGLAQFYSVNG